MTNDRLAAALHKVKWIRRHLAYGHVVQASAPEGVKRYTYKDINLFQAGPRGVFVRSGKLWNPIDHCFLTAIAM